MPIPGSQEMNSISLAYFLHSNRWLFRALFGLMMIFGLPSLWKHSKIMVILFLALTGVAIYFANFKMVADHMFYQPNQLSLLDAVESKIDKESTGF